jgi:hypothetical protein
MNPRLSHPQAQVQQGKNAVVNVVTKLNCFPNP